MTDPVLEAVAELVRERDHLDEHVTRLEAALVALVEGVEIRTDERDLCLNATNRMRQRFPELFEAKKS